MDEKCMICIADDGSVQWIMDTDDPNKIIDELAREIGMKFDDVSENLEVWSIPLSYEKVEFIVDSFGINEAGKLLLMLKGSKLVRPKGG